MADEERVKSFKRTCSSRRISGRTATLFVDNLRSFDQKYPSPRQRMA